VDCLAGQSGALYAFVVSGEVKGCSINERSPGVSGAFCLSYEFSELRASQCNSEIPRFWLRQNDA
jgi:hypothetical protein